MIELSHIPMSEWSLAWRLTDPRYDVLPEEHLRQIRPLDRASEDSLTDLVRHWFKVNPFADEAFEDVVSLSLTAEDETAPGRVEKWLYELPTLLPARVFLLWDTGDGAETSWEMVVSYWNALWYPSDDVVVFDESLSWAVHFHHHDRIFFGSRPKNGAIRNWRDRRA